MASSQSAERLKTILRQLTQCLDPTDGRFYRTHLGAASLESALKPKIDDTLKKARSAIENSELVSGQVMENVADILFSVGQQTDEISNLDDSTYVGQWQNHISNINAKLEELKFYWPHFIAAAVEQKGLLDDEEEEIKTQHQRALEEFGQKAEKTLENLKEESKKVLEQAAKTAQEIREKARLTAAGISVEAAQKQFNEAQEEFQGRTILWGVFSVISIATFIWVAFHFANNSRPDEKMGAGIIYFTALRITILAAIGGVAAFCLKILRANMHMRAHNLHRQRLANSMAAFVESASTNEQRDLILAHLVDAIASFGSSGLLAKPDDSVSPSKMTIDTINRTLSGTSR